MSVLLVSECPATREGLRNLLECEQIEALKETTTEGAAKLAYSVESDLVFLDPGSSMREGVLLCYSLKELPDPPKVVIYTSEYPPHALAVAAIGGADGCIHGHLPQDELQDAIDRALAGKPAWASATDEEQTHRVMAAACKVSRLSRRERQVLGMLTQRKTNQEISAALHVSPRTVKNHMTSLLRKLGYTDRTELWGD
jgi:NarL family two-component system response regulator LiaR